MKYVHGGDCINRWLKCSSCWEYVWLLWLVNIYLLEPWDEDPEFESPVAFWVRIWRKSEVKLDSFVGVKVIGINMSVERRMLL